MSPLTVQFQRGGVYLPKLRLWLDPHEPQTGPDRVFISHAHSDHIGRHREVILSAPTARLMRARIHGEWEEHVLSLGQPAPFVAGDTPYTLTLLGAGHIFGSAMAFLEAGDSTLLYTGDFKLRRSRSAEPCEPRAASVLIMETTYGRREYRFPAPAEVMQGVIRFCREALDNNETPVLLGYSLGKSQELLCGLAEAGLPIVLHGQIHKLTEIYKEFGQSFPAYEKYEGASARGKVLLCPPGVSNSAMLRSLGRTRTAVMTGWAMDPNCRFRSRADVAFPLSDHADFPELVEMVKAVNPKKIYTLHGFAADFAQTLREMGYDAQALSEEDQLALVLGDAREAAGGRKTAWPAIGSPKAEGKGPRSEASGQSPVASGDGIAQTTMDNGRRTTDACAPADSFQRFADTCRQIGSTPKKLEKIGWLADYLKTLDSASLAPVNSWLTGNPFPPVQNKVLQLGWATIRDALCAVGEMDQARFGQIYLKHSDLGETAGEILQQRNSCPPTLKIGDIENLFQQLYAASGPLAKAPLLVRVLRGCTPQEAKYLIKILTGDLRIGLKEGLLEEAIAQAFQAPLEAVKNANLLVGDIGEAARLAHSGTLAAASLIPFRPVKYMLASPEETAQATWERVQEWSSASPATTDSQTHPAPAHSPENSASRITHHASALLVWIEDKYDGIRAQLHKVGQRVVLYSRDLKDITDTFFELADTARSIPADFVVDGEIVAMRGDRALPFTELQRRLGRRERDLFLSDEIPVRFIAFDLLWRAGESFLNKPLRTRREALEPLAPLQFSKITEAGSAAKIEAAFAAARGRGNEGLMIKDPDSVYSPGRRGLAWLKLKKAYGTLDCVVVGAEYGHGKRKGVLSDYTFAVRDELAGQLKAIGKAYTGLTDAEIVELTRHFLGKVLQRRGRYLEVEPDTVLEIAFDAIQPSTRHASGLAMRFPRILRIRRDKTPAEIDTIATAQRLVRGTDK